MPNSGKIVFKVTLSFYGMEFCYLNTTYLRTCKWKIRKTTHNNHSIVYTSEIKNLHKNKQLQILAMHLLNDQLLIQHITWSPQSQTTTLHT